MKVNGSDPLSRLRDMLDKLEEADRSQRASGRDRGKSEGAERTGSANDSVQLSVQAQEIAKLREAIETSPEVREEVVERLRQEIASGQYRIDGTKIADALLGEDLGR